MFTLGEEMDLDRLEAAIAEAKEVEDRPTLIVARTHIGIGSPHKQDTHAAHGSPLGEEEVRLTKEAYGWPPDKEFYVPDDVLAHYREAIDRGREWQAGGGGRVKGHAAAEPQAPPQPEGVYARPLPAGWDRQGPPIG